MEEKKTVKFNKDLLLEKLNDKGMTARDLSLLMGMGEGYISDRKRHGCEMSDTQYRLMCALLGCTYQQMLYVEPKKSESVPAPSNDDGTMKFVLNKLQDLGERIKVLEQNKINVTDKELVVLLLQQMTKFGQCEEGQFKSKAKSYGFSNELINFAIDNQKCKRDINAGKVWLVRK